MKKLVQLIAILLVIVGIIVIIKTITNKPSGQSQSIELVALPDGLS